MSLKHRALIRRVIYSDVEEYIYYMQYSDFNYDTVAEWLRRGPAKLVRSACASSILVGVAKNRFFGLVVAPQMLVVIFILI